MLPPSVHSAFTVVQTRQATKFLSNVFFNTIALDHICTYTYLYDNQSQYKKKTKKLICQSIHVSSVTLQRYGCLPSQKSIKVKEVRYESRQRQRLSHLMM